MGGTNANLGGTTDWQFFTTVFGGSGSDTVDGSLGNDTITGGAGDDSLVGRAGNDSIEGGAGNDTIDDEPGGSGAGADYFDGGAGNDVIYAGNDADTLVGGADNDSLFGEDGDDSLVGGTGADSIDGGTGADTIALSDGFGADTIDGGEGDGATDVLDASGVTGTGVDVTYTGIETGTLTDGTDTLSFSGIERLVLTGQNDTVDGFSSPVALNVDGGGGDDDITGSNDATSNDTLFGGAGNDSLRGWWGDDSLVGGTGDDLLTGDSGNDTVIGGTGNDTLSTWTGAATLDGGDDADELILFAGAVGGDINGATLTGGEGGTDFDTVNVWDTSNGVTVTYTGTEQGNIVDGGSTATFSQIEALNLTDNADSVNAAADSVGVTVDAGAGDDTITGGSGDDTLVGGLGGDTVVGGAGSDSISGGAGADSLEGGDDADTFVVADGFGSDTIVGGEGGTDADRIDAAGLTGAVTVNITNEAGTLTDGTDTLSFSQIESITLTGQADSLVAFGTSDLTVDAGAGADAIQEGNGNNTLSGGDDSDVFYAGYGVSTITGGEGGTDADMISFERANDAVDLTFSGTEAGTYSDSDGDSGTFTEIEQIFGTTGNDTIDATLDTSTGLYLDSWDGNDTIAGGSGDDTIDGGAGEDTLTGNGGADFIFAGSGTDSVSGGAGADSLDGGAQADTLDGGADDDTIDGGTGNDSLTGGLGDDTFVYNAGDGFDTITDFNTGNTGTLTDGDTTNNDFVDLSTYYDHLSELWADYLDDGVLNQSNATDMLGNAVNYGDNTSFAGGGIAFNGGTAGASFFNAENTGVVCFTPGTMIRVPGGEVPIETLRPGDLVVTKDNGVKPLLWIGERQLTATDFSANPKLLPVLLPAIAFGFERDLIVSPQHGILLRSKDRGGDEILYRARHLTGLPGSGARMMRGATQVRYIHLFFEQHEVVFSNSAASESMYPGKEAVKSLSPAARTELEALFPRLCGGPPRGIYGHPARSYSQRKALPEHIESLQMAL